MNIKNIKVKILSMAIAFVIAFSINAYAQFLSDALTLNPEVIVLFIVPLKPGVFISCA